MADKIWVKDGYAQVASDGRLATTKCDNCCDEQYVEFRACCSTGERIFVRKSVLDSLNCPDDLYRTKTIHYQNKCYSTWMAGQITSRSRVIELGFKPIDGGFSCVMVDATQDGCNEGDCPPCPEDCCNIRYISPECGADVLQDYPDAQHPEYICCNWGSGYMLRWHHRETMNGVRNTVVGCVGDTYYLVPEWRGSSIEDWRAIETITDCNLYNATCVKKQHLDSGVVIRLEYPEDQCYRTIEEPYRNQWEYDDCSGQTNWQRGLFAPIFSFENERLNACEGTIDASLSPHHIRRYTWRYIPSMCFSGGWEWTYYERLETDSSYAIGAGFVLNEFTQTFREEWTVEVTNWNGCDRQRCNQPLGRSAIEPPALPSALDIL